MSRTTVFVCKFVGTVGLGLLTVSWLWPQVPPPKSSLVSEINPRSFCVGSQLYNIHNDDSCSVPTTNPYPRTLHFSSPPQRDVSTTSSTLHNRRLFVTRCICPLSASGATSVLTMGDPSCRPRIQPGGCGSL